MKIAVIGSGYVGTTTAAVLTSLHHHVTAADIDITKVKKLKQGILPFVEPGLDKFLISMLETGRLNFTADIYQAVKDNQVLLIAVGTPSRADGTADLRFLQSVADTIACSIHEYKVIVIKSTVPVGTNRWFSDYLGNKIGNPHMFDVISNPEFLREGNALQDMLHPDRTVIGGKSQKAIQIVKEIYESMQSNLLVTDWETAELIKYASNSFLATKISFINEIARIAEHAGADVVEIARGMGMDSRIGSEFLRAGIGFGGSCFPKDLKALIATAKELGADSKILEAVEYINRTQPNFYTEKLNRLLQKIAKRPWKIAILGLTFKPDTDDQRESPAIQVVNHLLEECEEIRIIDPTIQTRNQTPWPHEQKVTICRTTTESLSGADAVILCTDWEQFSNIDWKEAASHMRHPVLLDGRNMFDPDDIRSAGMRYLALGRGEFE
ncbi:UDP-glucose 6-dehydrogenase [Collibacillus ludicampi]|uniref:UDP-glucose 6-dehydrogenase n=1 Tax=Collibacillus ludicampi TaxID=2771369 RepID=A0AAV4LHD3_9BACL|nr:UDP-glucose/GDP-mannose dehydrogenase family protein [Collibacillus ludicampi]GIM47104.1 UDP-glucose 6-dehydrogenase [Collibacillus ludicampi]